jgi:fatty-acyl-CoA synthase
MWRGPVAVLLTDALKWWTSSYPERTALVVGDEEVTYGRLGEWTDRVANYLCHEVGTVPGAVVAIAGANSMEWCVAALGAIKAGAIVTPFNYRYTAMELMQLVENCSPSVILADDQERAKLIDVEVGGSPLDIIPLARIRELASGPVAPFRSPDVTPTSPLVIAYTSGTTGVPKGIVYTHESLLWALFELMLKDPIPTEEASMLLALPLFTVAGIKHALLHSVARGGKLVVMKDMDPIEAFDLLSRHRISQMNGVPVLWERMAAAPGFDGQDFSHLKVALVGGARVSESLLAAWFERGVALRHMYGMTEAGGCVSVPRPESALAHPELCGDGSIFTEVKTVRPDGSDCDPGEAGEILMRGPAMMKEYWNNPEASEALIKDGWMHSGDLGIIEKNGYLRYVDRLKDMIISGGFNVYPSEIERLIAQQPGVLEVAVVPVPDDQWGEAGAAIVYAKGEVDSEAVLAALRSELAVFKVPRYIVRSDQPLPRMSSGKIAKRQLKEEYADLPTRGVSV